MEKTVDVQQAIDAIRYELPRMGDAIQQLAATQQRIACAQERQAALMEALLKLLARSR